MSIVQIVSPYLQAMVPRVYTEVQEFILSCLQFSEDLQLTQAELDETVRRSANLLLTRTLSGCLR